jgi:hypothetical protein
MMLMISVPFPCVIMAGVWASIAEHIQPSLTAEQVERLAFGFQVYLEKVSVITCYVLNYDMRCNITAQHQNCLLSMRAV